MRRATAYREPQMFSTMNVTPFIDVMLVLLVVLILTLPMQSHKVPIELPAPNPAPPLQEVAHKLTIDRGGALWWDGRRIAEAELRPLLASVQANRAQVLHVQTDPEAPYNRFDQILAAVKAAGITRLGFIGNERMTL